MIKKITFASVTTLALLVLPAQAEGMKCQAGKCGAGMMGKAKQDNQMMQKKKMHKMKKSSPFLIKHGLPHLTTMIKQNWDDVKLALTDEQKTKLLTVRKETMGAVMKLKPEVTALRQEIIQASKAGTKAADLKEKVEKLADLEAEATMVHLNCLDNSTKILDEKQLAYLMEKGKEQKMMKKMKMKGMKCASGKCGGQK